MSTQLNLILKISCLKDHVFQTSTKMKELLLKSLIHIQLGDKRFYEKLDSDPTGECSAFITETEHYVYEAALSCLLHIGTILLSPKNPQGRHAT